MLKRNFHITRIHWKCQIGVKGLTTFFFVLPKAYINGLKSFAWIGFGYTNIPKYNCTTNVITLICIYILRKYLN